MENRTSIIIKDSEGNKLYSYQGKVLPKAGDIVIYNKEKRKILSINKEIFIHPFDKENKDILIEHFVCYIAITDKV